MAAVCTVLPFRNQAERLSWSLRLEHTLLKFEAVKRFFLRRCQSLDDDCSLVSTSYSTDCSLLIERDSQNNAWAGKNRKNKFRSMSSIRIWHYFREGLLISKYRAFWNVTKLAWNQGNVFTIIWPYSEVTGLGIMFFKYWNKGLWHVQRTKRLSEGLVKLAIYSGHFLLFLSFCGAV